MEAEVWRDDSEGDFYDRQPFVDEDFSKRQMVVDGDLDEMQTYSSEDLYDLEVALYSQIHFESNIDTENIDLKPLNSTVSDADLFTIQVDSSTDNADRQSLKELQSTVAKSSTRKESDNTNIFHTTITGQFKSSPTNDGRALSKSGPSLLPFMLHSSSRDRTAGRLKCVVEDDDESSDSASGADSYSDSRCDTLTLAHTTALGETSSAPIKIWDTDSSLIVLEDTDNSTIVIQNSDSDSGSGISQSDEDLLVLDEWQSRDSEDDIQVNMKDDKPWLTRLNWKESDWKISEDDRPFCTSSRSRYYKTPSFRCNNCNEAGHLSKSCPKPKKEEVCSFCSETGHRRNFCPNSICYNCYAPGHNTKSCTDPKRNPRVFCFRCSMLGHERNKCPEIWRQYHMTTDPGQFKKMKTRENVRMYCYNCSSDDHFGHDCNEERIDYYTKPSFPFVCQYSAVREWQQHVFFRSDEMGYSPPAKRRKLQHGQTRYLPDFKAKPSYQQQKASPIKRKQSDKQTISRDKPLASKPAFGAIEAAREKKRSMVVSGNGHRTSVIADSGSMDRDTVQEVIPKFSRGQHRTDKKSSKNKFKMDTHKEPKKWLSVAVSGNSNRTSMTADSGSFDRDRVQEVAPQSFRGQHRTDKKSSKNKFKTDDKHSPRQKGSKSSMKQESRVVTVTDGSVGRGGRQEESFPRGGRPGNRTGAGDPRASQNKTRTDSSSKRSRKKGNWTKDVQQLHWKQKGIKGRTVHQPGGNPLSSGRKNEDRSVVASSRGFRITAKNLSLSNRSNRC